MNPVELSGQLYLANSSTHKTATANFLINGTIEVINSSDSEVVVSACVSDVKLSDKLGDTPRQIIFPDGHLFSFFANGEVEQWLKKQGHKSSLNKLEQNKQLIIYATLLVPLMLFATFKYIIPAVAINFASIIPQSAIEVASNHSLYSLDKTVLSPSQLEDETKEAHLSRWYQKLAILVDTEQQYQIEFRHSKFFGANAFALPNGTIVITDDLVELLKDNNDALFAILLHEIGHVEHQHSMRYIAESLATAMVVNYLFGDVSAMVDLFVGTGATMIGNTFSQNLEWEADNFAIETLKRNNLSTESFAEAMEALLSTTAETKLDKLLSTHPLLKERAENARQR